MDLALNYPVNDWGINIEKEKGTEFGDGKNIALEREKILTDLLLLLKEFRNADTLQKKLEILVEGIRTTGWRRVHLYVYDFRQNELKSAASHGLTKGEIEYLIENPLKLKDIEYIFRGGYNKFRIGLSYYFPHDCDDEFIQKQRVSGVYSSITPEEFESWHPEDILYFPILDLYGKIIGLVSVDDPVSGKRPTEESLREVELFIDYATFVLTETEFQDYFSKTKGLISRLFDLSPAMIIIVESDGRIIDINNSVSKDLGYLPNDLIGKAESSIFSSDINFSNMSRIRAQGVFNGEILLSCKDGTELWGYMSSVPVFDTHGEIDGYITTIVDITESKQLQQYLIRAEKLAGIGVLASGIAHEINNPLYAILGLAEEILDFKELPESLDPMVKEILKYTEDAADIVKNLSSYTYSAQREAPSSVDLNAIIGKAIKMIERSANVSGVVFELDLAEIPVIQASTGEITQVFANLITNALGALKGEGGIISIKTRHVGDNVECRIRDSGSGIPEEIGDRIFEPFFTTKDVGKGTGLGLYVCYRILTKHRGSIVVESTSSEGTCFLVTIPTPKNGISEM